MKKSNGDILTDDELKSLLKKDDFVYLYDVDGIEKDKPNLCIYQMISQFYKMWTDHGPRVLGDVVDSVMAGATNITLREKLWPKMHIPSVREITECNIFTEIKIPHTEIQNIPISTSYNVDGYVLIDNNIKIEKDFQVCSFLKNFCINNKLYVYESNLKNISYWKNLGVAGILVDIDKIKEAH